jgi:ribosome-binding protein aMBF1 (putative translation factor)
MCLEGQTSPIGSSSEEARRRRTTRSATYRSEAARLAPYEALARMVIARRIRYGLTQGRLAALMGTSVSAISRLESGRHRPNLETLENLAHAIGERFVVGFEDESGVRSIAAPDG